MSFLQEIARMCTLLNLVGVPLTTGAKASSSLRQPCCKGRKKHKVAVHIRFPGSLVDMRTCELTWRALSEVLQGIGGMDVNF